MNSLDKMDLNINQILMNCGLMYGIYEDGVIKATEFGMLNMAFTFTILTIQATKCFVLIFFHEDSQVAIYMGEFLQYFGPKVVVDSAACIFFTCSAISIVLFCLMSNKMFFWIDHMEFDRETRCFHKLNLNVSDSNRFIKQLELLWLIVNPVAYFFGLITGSAVLASFLIFKNDYYQYYLPSILLLTVAVWKFAHNLIALLLILYQVNKLIKFNKFNKLNLNCNFFVVDRFAFISI